MPDVVRRLASAVAPGGTLLVVGHHPEDLATGLRHGHNTFMFTADQLLPGAAGRLRGRGRARRGRARRRTRSTGEEIAIADAVLRARRAG